MPLLIGLNVKSTKIATNCAKRPEVPRLQLTVLNGQKYCTKIATNCAKRSEVPRLQLTVLNG